MIHDLHAGFLLLREQLQFVAESPRNQALLIERWLAPNLAENAVAIRSYARELLPVLLDAVTRIPAVGSPPQFLGGIERVLRNSQQRFPDLVNAAEVEHATTELARKKAAVMAFLGDVDAGMDGPYRDLFRASLEAGLNEFQTLLLWIDFLHEEKIVPPSFEPALVDAWKEMTRTQYGSAHVPLLEAGTSNDAVPGLFPFGTVARLHLVTQELPAADQPDLVVLTHQLAKTHANGHAITDIIELVRRSAGAYIVPYKQTRYSVTISYDGIDLPQSGSSDGLAIAVNLVSALSRVSFDKKYYSAAGQAVFTGWLNRGGTLDPLDDALIERKIETVFFSPYATFVVPKANEDAALRALYTLREMYPRRSLEIVPVQTLDEVFDRRSVITVTPLRVPERLGKTARRYRTALLIFFALFPLLFIAAHSYFSVDRDDNPAAIRMKNNVFTVENKKGRALWQELMGSVEYPMTDARRKEAEGCGLGDNWSCICDVDRDGRNEVLLCHPWYTPGMSDSLYCFRFDHSLAWKVKLGRPVRTPEGNYLTVQNTILAVWAGAIDRRGPSYIVVVSGTKFYSYFITVLDADGRILGEYFHPGRISSFAVIDAEGSGHREILCAAWNNGLEASVLFLLDPLHCTGCAPTTERYRPVSPALDAGTEKQYLRFPTSDAARVENTITQRVPYFAPPAGNGVEVTIPQAIVPRMLGVQPDAIADLVFDLDPRLHARTVQTTSYFDILATYLFVKKKMAKPFNEEARQRLMEGIEYWDGTRFMRAWTLNAKFYPGASAHGT